MRWCCWRCWWRLASQRWEGCWWWRWLWFPPVGGSSPGGIAPSEGKSAPTQLPPQGSSAPPETPLFIYFYRSKNLIYHNMGTGGGLGCPPPTRACLGAWRALVSCGHQAAPLWWLFALVFFYIFQNNSPQNFSSFGDVQNWYLWHSFFRSRIPAAGNLPLCVNLTYLWEKRH